MTLQGVIEEIKSWELPFYAEPSRKKVIETISADVVRITAERDALMKDLKKVPLCHCCKYDSSGNDEVCYACLINSSKWEWRGIE